MRKRKVPAWGAGAVYLDQIKRQYKKKLLAKWDEQKNRQMKVASKCGLQLYWFVNEKRFESLLNQRWKTKPLVKYVKYPPKPDPQAQTALPSLPPSSNPTPLPLDDPDYNCYDSRSWSCPDGCCT